MTAREVNVNAEGGGWVADCACGWLRWAPTYPLAETYGDDHRCLKPRKQADR